MAIGQQGAMPAIRPQMGQIPAQAGKYSGQPQGSPTGPIADQSRMAAWREQQNGFGGQGWNIDQGLLPPPRETVNYGGYQRNAFDAFPQWSGLNEASQGRFANKAVYDEYAGKRLGDMWGNVGPSQRTAMGFPGWWRPGMAPIYSDQGGGGNVNTGIDAGPIYNNQQVDQAYSGTASPTSQPVTGTVGNPLSQYMGTLQGIYGQQDAVNLARGMAQGNASQSLASQRARAGAGLDWANLGFGDYSSQVQNQSAQQNALLSLLQGLI